MPEIPVLAEPLNDALNISINTDLKWNTVATADFYTLQVSKASDFSTLLIDQSNLTDTVFSPTGLENNTTYYWRVSASNVAGDSEPSSTWEFTCIVALPDIPVLAEPLNDAVNIPIHTDLKWNTVATADYYKLQVSKSSDFSIVLIDQTSLTDTVFSPTGLENNTTYYWHACASNDAGDGLFSNVWNFSTSLSTDVSTIDSLPNNYILLQAYPNSFNSITTFKYNLPEKAHVSLVIYNNIGQKVVELMSDDQQAGEYKLIWNGLDYRGIPVKSGLYLCHFKSGNNSFTQKILLKRKM